MFSRVDVLPKKGGPEGILTWVIAVMVYLTALAMGAGLTLRDSARAWHQDVARTLSVQFAGAAVQTMENEVSETLKVLRGFPGVERAEPLTQSEITALLEPWLGTGNLTADMPVPRMIDVVLRPGAVVDLAALRQTLGQVAPHAQLDDHQQWLGRIVDLVVALQAMALGIIVLIALITVAIVVFATRAGLATHRDIIEIVHLIGARDSTIAAEFQWRLLAVGLKGGVIGLALAVATMFGVARLLAGLQASFLPKLGMSAAIAGGLAALPLAIGLLTMLTAFVTVRRTLARIV
ncbi:MAG: cell division protein FtsX [Sphingomonadales bacterium]